MCSYSLKDIEKELSNNKFIDFKNFVKRFKDLDKLDLIYTLVRDNIL